MKYYYDEDVNLELIRNRKIAVIGYGNQGKAHAQNLHDSGLNIKVGLRPGSSSAAVVKSHGLEYGGIAELAEWADIISIMTPDETQAETFNSDILPHLKEGNLMTFAHGFNIQYGYIKAPVNVDVVLNSPKCIGYHVRDNFTKGKGFPNLIAVHRNYTGKAKEYALAYSKGIGGTLAGTMDSTVEEETVTNLFGEQTILCGGITNLIKAAFETLVEAGFSREVAYMECLQEIRPILSLFTDHGLAEMNERISNTAEFGEYVSGGRVIDDRVKDSMREVLNDIRNGKFAKRYMDDMQSGGKELLAMRKDAAEHDIEIVGREIRDKLSMAK